MMRRARRWAIAIALLGALAAMSLGAARGQDASAGDSGGLLGYTGHASAPGIEFVYDNNAFPVPSHPVFTGTLPEATADLQAGPTGTAFASIAWPGSLAGNLGTTINQLNQLCAPPNLMVPCLPITDQEKQLLGGANDPVRAYATSSGKNDASYGGGGGLYMRAHADGNGTLATADAGVTSVAGDPVLTLGSVTSHAGSVVTSSTITGEATSSITGITVGTNLPIPNVPVPANTSILTIDSVTSIARSVSDGQKQVRPTGEITVAGVKVLGQPASIDQKGLHLGGQGTALTPATKALQDAARQALASIKFAVTFAPEPDLRVTGTQAVAEVGGITISFATSDGSSYKITLGKALAMADASPNIDFAAEVPGVAGGGLGGTEPAATGGGAAGGDTGSVSGGESLTDTSGSAGGAGGGGSETVLPTGVLASGTPPSGKGIDTALIVLVVLGAGALAFGMKRLSDDVLSQRAGMTCPNEGNTT
jgi:hypothetical protein